MAGKVHKVSYEHRATIVWFSACYHEDGDVYTSDVEALIGALEWAIEYLKSKCVNKSPGPQHVIVRADPQLGIWDVGLVFEEPYSFKPE